MISKVLWNKLLLIKNYMSYLVDCKQIFWPILGSYEYFDKYESALYNLDLIFYDRNNIKIINPFLILFFLRYFERMFEKNPNDEEFNWINYESKYVKELNLNYKLLYNLYLKIKHFKKSDKINIEILEPCKHIKIHNEEFFRSLLFLLVKKRKINTFIDSYKDCRVEGYDKKINDLMYFDEGSKILYLN